jgi:signal transduction histidine kinase
MGTRGDRKKVAEHPQMSPGRPPTAQPPAAELLLRALSAAPPDVLPGQFLEFLRQLPVGILITDHGGREFHRNEVARELLNEPDSRLSARGDPAGNLFFRCGTNETVPAAEVPLAKALAGERSVADLELQHAERGRVRLRAWGSPLRDSDGVVRLAIMALVDVTSEKLLEDAVREQSRVQERERLAEAIHDDVLQSLSAARLRLSASRGSDGDVISVHAAMVDSLLTEAVRKLRSIVTDLRPWPDHDRSLADALSTALVPLRTEGVEVTLEDRLAGDPGEPANSTLRRVCAEAITNCHKHARPRSVAVCLHRQDDRIVASVVDDGIGFTPVTRVRHGHFGLSLMRERVARLGGDLSIDSMPGRGTAVRLWIPDPIEGYPDS